VGGGEADGVEGDVLRDIEAREGAGSAGEEGEDTAGGGAILGKEKSLTAGGEDLGDGDVLGGGDELAGVDGDGSTALDRAVGRDLAVDG
jgi:hypothetical protein